MMTFVWKFFCKINILVEEIVTYTNRSQLQDLKSIFVRVIFTHYTKELDIVGHWNAHWYFRSRWDDSTSWTHSSLFQSVHIIALHDGGKRSTIFTHHERVFLQYSDMPIVDLGIFINQLDAILRFKSLKGARSLIFRTYKNAF